MILHRGENLPLPPIFLNSVSFLRNRVRVFRVRTVLCSVHVSVQCAWESTAWQACPSMFKREHCSTRASCRVWRRKTDIEKWERGKRLLCSIWSFDITKIKQDKNLSPCLAGHRGVTERWCLSWLTNSNLVYEPKCWGRGGVVGSQTLSTSVHRSPNKLWRSIPYLTYAWHQYLRMNAFGQKIAPSHKYMHWLSFSPTLYMQVAGPQLLFSIC